MISDDSLHYAYKNLKHPRMEYKDYRTYLIEFEIYRTTKLEIEQEMIKRKMFTHIEIYGE